MRRLIVPALAMTIRLPSDLMEDIKNLHFDPLTKRTRYGSINALITQLLSNWRDERLDNEKLRNATHSSPLNLKELMENE